MAFGDHEPIKQENNKAIEQEPEQVPDLKHIHAAPSEPKTHKVQVHHVAASGNKPKADIEKSLRAIYQDDTGELPDMTKLEHRKSRGWMFALVIVVALGLAAGAAWVGFLIFSPYVMHSDSKLEVGIKGPDSVASLEATTITVSYANRNDSALSSGEIHLNIPQEFHMTGSEPQPASDGSTWMFSSLAPGAKDSVTITGYFIAEGGTNAAFQSVARYSPAGISTKYEDISTKTITVNGSKLEATVDAPPEAVVGEKTTFTFHVKNTASMRVEHIIFTPKIPDSFLLATSQPKADTKGAIEVGTLDPDQEAKIIITGTFAANHEDSENVGGTVAIATDAFAVPQREAVAPVRVISSDLEMRALVNGSAEDQTVDFGGRLRLSLIYKNNGSQPMTGMTATVTLDSTPDTLIDWKKFDDDTKDNKTFMRKGETITINSKLNKAFEAILAQTTGTLSFTIPLVTKAPGDVSKAHIIVTSHATVAMIGKNKVTKTVDTTPFTITPNTDLALVGGAAYFDEDAVPIGGGALPPMVGEETKYKVQWELTNSIHDVKGLVVKTQLANGITWTGNTNSEGGTLTYDDTTRTVTWKIDSLAATTPFVKSYFEIAVTPTASQLDSFIPLTTGATLTATDVATGAIITQSSVPDTSELPLDINAKDKGLVVPAKK